MRPGILHPLQDDHEVADLDLGDGPTSQRTALDDLIEHIALQRAFRFG